MEALDKSSMSVLPRRDPVSMVDRHGGIQQQIECNAGMILHEYASIFSDLELSISACFVCSDDSPSCHYSERSFCEIWQECGDTVARNITFTRCVCGKYVLCYLWIS